MEVKVWVEGIQRVVCGVTDKTNCQDIVFALAHATGKIGRFTLVEKWRDNERLLSPADFPLQLLQKWGEYASDVHFILKPSDNKDKKRQSSGRRKREKADGMPPSVTLQDGKASSTAIKKSLTFSGVHARTNTDLRLGNRLIHHAQQSSLPNGYDDDPVMPDLVTQDSKYRLKKNGHLPNDHKTGLSPYQKQVPNHIKEHISSSLASDPNHVSGVNGQVPPLEKHHKTATGSPILTNGASPHRGRELNSTSKELEERLELMRLISHQENRLKDQANRLKELSSEIDIMPDLQDTEYSLNVEDISKLQSNELGIQEELNDLELVSWPDKLALEKTEQNALRSELSDLKESLTQTQQSLEQRITQKSNLTKDINEQTENLQRKHLDQKSFLENEIKTKSDELNKLNKMSSEFESSLQHLVSGSQSCDTSIVERRLQLADLEKDLKAFNFENFTKVPSLLTVEDKPISKQRPGSARRLTSNPQNLGEKVATARDPQGLWV